MHFYTVFWPVKHTGHQWTHTHTHISPLPVHSQRVPLQLLKLPHYLIADRSKARLKANYAGFSPFLQSKMAPPTVHSQPCLHLQDDGFARTNETSRYFTLASYVK